MTAPMTLNFHGLGSLGAWSNATIGHHYDISWCFDQGDQNCVKGIENTVKSYYTTNLYNQIPGTLRDAVRCYANNECNPSPELAQLIKSSAEGVLSPNLQTRMAGYINAGGLTGSDFTPDPETAEQIDAFKDATCKAAAAFGERLPGCPALTGGTTAQTVGSSQPAPKSETNWLLYAGIGLGALVLLGGVALIARKRSAVHGLRGLSCGYAGCHGMGGLGKYQPWNARAAARYNARQYPCR